MRFLRRYAPCLKFYSGGSILFYQTCLLSNCNSRWIALLLLVFSLTLSICFPPLGSVYLGVVIGLGPLARVAGLSACLLLLFLLPFRVFL